jgi:hypothetical protein
MWLMKRTVALACVLAVSVLAAPAGIAGGGQAKVRYVPMRDAAAVARSYQAYLNRSGFSQRCKAVSALMVRCWGMTATSDPNQRWHPWSTEIRKVPIVKNGKRVFAAERRIWMDYRPEGKPGLDPVFVRWAGIKGW